MDWTFQNLLNSDRVKGGKWETSTKLHLSTENKSPELMIEWPGCPIEIGSLVNNKASGIAGMPSRDREMLVHGGNITYYFTESSHNNLTHWEISKHRDRQALIIVHMASKSFS